MHWRLVFGLSLFGLAMAIATVFIIPTVSSIWITAAHVLLFDQYVATHAKEATMMQSMPMSPRVMMAVTGPIVGVLPGLVLGLFAWIASKLVSKNAVQKSG